MRLRVLRGVVSIAALLVLAVTGAHAQQRSVDEFKNNLAPYVRSPEHVIEKMLDMARLKPGDTLYDLGCGDGNILLRAAEKYRVKAVGVEISGRLARQATDKVKKAGLQDQVTIVHGDFMQTDLSSANVVTLYLVTTANEILRPNLERELKPNTRVVSYDYPIPGWRAIDTVGTAGLHGDAHTIYLYEVPDSIKK